jgi:hypothetical protein
MNNSIKTYQIILSHTCEERRGKLTSIGTPSEHLTTISGYNSMVLGHGNDLHSFRPNPTDNLSWCDYSYLTTANASAK